MVVICLLGKILRSQVAYYNELDLGIKNYQAQYMSCTSLNKKPCIIDLVLYDILDEAKINTNKFLFIFRRSELCSSSREATTVEVCGGYCHGYGAFFYISCSCLKKILSLVGRRVLL